MEKNQSNLMSNFTTQSLEPDMHFYAAGIVKSMGRAIKRGRLTTNGILMPRRPYNNRANTSKRTNTHSRVQNETKRKIYRALCQL